MNLGNPLIDIKFVEPFWKSLQPIDSKIIGLISSLIHYRIIRRTNFIEEAILEAAILEAILIVLNKK